MLKTKTLETSLCARCQTPIGLVQINGKTVCVEPTIAYQGTKNGLLVLVLHHCEPMESPKDFTNNRPQKVL